jgi:hypothetical protein
VVVRSWATAGAAGSGGAAGAGGGAGAGNAGGHAGAGGVAGGGGLAAGGASGGGGSGGAAPDPTVTFTDFQLSINCMPIIPADPLNGTFTVTYSNPGSGQVSIVVLEADLLVTTATSSLDWVFSVTPEAQTIAGGSWVNVQQTKVPGSGMLGSGSGSLCDYCGAPATIKLYLEHLQHLVIATSPSMTIPCLH